MSSSHTVHLRMTDRQYMYLAPKGLWRVEKGRAAKGFGNTEGMGAHSSRFPAFFFLLA